jgi:radical SAM protein with 4Fe4S-binding SPASM domain
MLDFFRNISGPITLHLEITEVCTERCRHCYNFVRDPGFSPKVISNENIDFFLDDFKANGGLHVILTGGEPLASFNKLMYAVEGIMSRGFTLSLNSNLMLAVPDKMKALRKAGVEHILTTLFSHDPETHDFIASRPGAHSEILKGIEVSRDAGIRVSVNMIVTNVNDRHVYETGKLLHSLGHRKFIANRMIPSTTNSVSLKKEFLMEEEATKRMVDDLLRLNSEFDMTVSTCRALPHCFLGDLDDNFAFTARGCNAGKRHLLLGHDGTARACVHEATEYGNVLEIGIKGVWNNMQRWRRKDLLPEGCQECPLVIICEGGCRQIAEVVHSDWSGKDNLCQGPDGLKEFHRGVSSELLRKIKDMSFSVNPDLEFRNEDGFYLVRIFGAKCVLVEKQYGDFLSTYKAVPGPFTIDDFPDQDAEELGLYLIYDIVRPQDEKEDFARLLEQYKR